MRLFCPDPGPSKTLAASSPAQRRLAYRHPSPVTQINKRAELTLTDLPWSTLKGKYNNRDRELDLDLT
ncbi:hypothetical protein ACRALDRAFT_207685 [Sodiomyces alcalophilus JCM 7366]|uniref:uncharacterized protein n=1 Tax=Sodiomyces alcalophilus JCM 7366 TaxID=591952 RepID=UPI0039B4A6B9